MNLTYSDCQELKEYGFPQSGRGEYVEDVGSYDEMGMTVVAYAPTLSELISECGEGFAVLVRVDRSEDGKGIFFSAGYDKYAINHQTGATPEQAVKNLYVALNKKTV